MYSRTGVKKSKKWGGKRVESSGAADDIIEGHNDDVDDDEGDPYFRGFMAANDERCDCAEDEDGDDYR